MKAGSSERIKKNGIDYSLYHTLDGGCIIFEIEKFGQDYSCYTIHIENMESAADIFTCLARAVGCEVMNPYEEARYYSDSEL